VTFAAEAAGSGNGFLPILFLFGLLALMYFMVIRPQSQRRKQLAKMQDDLGPGAAVLTIGGLYGTIVALDDESVTLEVSPGVTNRYARGAIARVLDGDSPAEATDDPGVDVATSGESAVSDAGQPGSGSSGSSGKDLR
jgi:preprotein translocase subunit YajC